MGELKIDVNGDGLSDRVTWYWNPDVSGSFYSPIPRVEIAVTSDRYIPLEDLPAFKFKDKIFKKGDAVEKSRPDDVERFVYGFKAKVKSIQTAFRRFEQGVQLYLKVEPTRDCIFCRKSEREIEGALILHPELFKDEPEAAAAPAFP